MLAEVYKIDVFACYYFFFYFIYLSKHINNVAVTKHYLNLKNNGHFCTF